ncbi:MAG TPA: lytic murein transglycosylase [Patescibacteria group bacterium]|nr:lytic murein transglycosylase [Patescibacteria group bacterium]
MTTTWISVCQNFIMPLVAGLLATGTPTTETKTILAAEKKAELRGEFFAPVYEELLDRGVSPEFVDQLAKDQNIVYKDDYIKMNVQNIIPRPGGPSVGKVSSPTRSRSGKYSHNFTDYSVSQARAFVENNRTMLQAAEDEYGVPKEAIAAIMWVETKYGKFTGRDYVPNVYMNIAMANQPEFVNQSLRAARGIYGEGDTYHQVALKVKERADKKANWAIDELVALSQIQESNKFDITQLRGSFAGAFGLSQFLPSSYMQWAVDGDKDGKINLFEAPDAIYSVANYLKTNGWENTSQSHIKAVYHYNNSGDYVDAVLTLKERISAPARMNIASARKASTASKAIAKKPTIKKKNIAKASKGSNKKIAAKRKASNVKVARR